MNGMVFCGCSFTWGQGLYYYSDLKTIVEPPEYTFEWDLVRDAHKRYMYSQRWARLVANHFNTFEIVKNSNGGQENNSLEFLETIFQRFENSPSPENSPFYLKESFDYQEVSYIILQTSIPIRNNFEFELGGKKYSRDLGSSDPDVQNLLFEYIRENNINGVDGLHEQLVKQLFDKIIEAFQFYESKGIKCRILCWQDQYLGHIKSNPWMLDRFITLDYNGKTYDSIHQMTSENEHLWIKFDYPYFGENPPKDHHPSKECHIAVANSIIKKLESEL